MVLGGRPPGRVGRRRISHSTPLRGRRAFLGPDDRRIEYLCRHRPALRSRHDPVAPAGPGETVAREVRRQVVLRVARAAPVDPVPAAPAAAAPVRVVAVAPLVHVAEQVEAPAAVAVVARPGATTARAVLAVPVGRLEVAPAGRVDPVGMPVQRPPRRGRFGPVVRTRARRRSAGPRTVTARAARPAAAATVIVDRVVAPQAPAAAQVRAAGQAVHPEPGLQVRVPPAPAPAVVVPSTVRVGLPAARRARAPGRMTAVVPARTRAQGGALRATGVGRVDRQVRAAVGTNALRHVGSSVRGRRPSSVPMR